MPVSLHSTLKATTASSIPRWPAEVLGIIFYVICMSGKDLDQEAPLPGKPAFPLSTNVPFPFLLP